MRNDSRQQAHSCDSSALQKKMVLFIIVLGKELTQEINGDGAPSKGLLLTVKFESAIIADLDLGVYICGGG